MKKIYLITGGTSEMGVVLLKNLLSKGNDEDHFIIQGFKNIDIINHLKNEYPGQIDVYSVNLSVESEVQRFAELIRKNYPVITHYAHLPARNILYVDFADMDVKRFQTDMQLQLYSAISLGKVILPKMIENGGGRVVFMSTSILMGAPPSGTAAYTMIKGAIDSLAKCLAIEYAKYGITVNCISPAMIQTKFVSKAPLSVINMMTETNPMKRLGVPEDVAPGIEFLFSESARYITGINLPVTGGFDM